MREFLRRFRNFQKLFKRIEDFQRKSPLQKWKSFRDLGGAILKPTGVNVFDENFRVTLHTALPGFLFADLFGLLFYNVWLFKDDFFQICKQFAIIGAVVPSFLMYYNWVQNSTLRRYQALIFFTGKHIYRDHDVPPRYTEACDKSVTLMVKRAIQDISLFVIAIAIFGVLPAYLYFFEDTHLLVMPLKLPFIDPNTDTGFYLTQLHHLIYCFIGFSGMVGIELSTEMVKDSLHAQSVAIAYSFDELNDFLEKRSISKVELKLRLRNIFAQIGDFDRNFAEMTDLMYSRFFVQPMLLTASVTMSLFLFLADGWPMGVPYAMGMYTILFVLCKFGEEVQSTNDDVLEKMYDFSWYRLPVKQQEMIQQMMQYRQNTGAIQMGPFSELNYESASNLTKFCYNFTMTLIQMFK